MIEAWHLSHITQLYITNKAVEHSGIDNIMT